MRRVIWTNAALRDVQRVQDYIRQFNPLAAQRMALRLISTAQSLAEAPERGRPVLGGRRELTVVWPYIIRYRVQDDRVAILRVRHGARRPL